MSEAFLGLKISVLLHTGLRIEGVVSHLEPSTQQMTLKEATLLFPGQPPHHTPVYGIVGKEIKDLQVLAAATPSKPTTTKTKAPLDNHLLDHETFHQPQEKVKKKKTLYCHFKLTVFLGSNTCEVYF